MNRVSRWAAVSSSLAPCLLIGGWTLAARRQPPAYDSLRDTISALAGRGAADRWIMTSALTGLGVCHLVTASGLRGARAPGRLVLGVGGVATVGVAAFPLPAQGSSAAHVAVATTAFVALGAWPLAAARRTAASPLEAVPASLLAGGVLLGLVCWFGLDAGGAHAGLAERVAAGAQALWPLAFVAAARRCPGTRGGPVAVDGQGGPEETR